MQAFKLFLSCFISVVAAAQSQPVKKLICSHAWQEKPASAIWNFKDSGTFSAILFWTNKKKAGFTAKKGTFRLNDSTKTLEVTFDSTYSVYSKDSFSISKDVGLQVWNLITITSSRMVISRPPIWEFEKRAMINNGKNIIITLEGKKRNKRINIKR